MTYRLRPPFAACMHWALTCFLGSVILASLFTVVVRMINAESWPSHWLNGLTTLAMLLIAIVVGMGIALFGVFHVTAAIATPSHLRASSYWGKRVNVPWSSIHKIRKASMYGLPAFILQSDASRTELYVYVLGIDRKEAYSKLCSLAGPNNELTRCFAADKS